MYCASFAKLLKVSKFDIWKKIDILAIDSVLSKYVFKESSLNYVDQNLIYSKPWVAETSFAMKIYWFIDLL